MVVIILMVGVDVLSTSHRLLLCMHYTCMQQKQQSEGAKHRREGEEPDQTDRPKRRTPKPEEEKQKGLGANPGLETSQNSHSPSDKTFC